MHYTKGLKASAKQVLTKNINHFVDLLIKFFGQVALYEWLHAADVAKVYFDVDGKVADTTPERLLADARAGVRKFMGTPPDAPLPRIKTLFSHGGPKISYRLVLPDYRMKIADQKKRIVRLGLDKNRPFDAAPYGTNQKLRTVGSYKTEEDRRVMDLQRQGPLTDEDLVDTIVQHVTDDMELLTEPDQSNPPAKASKTAPPVSTPASAPASTSASAPASASEQRELAAVCAPAPKRHRGRPPKAASIDAEAHAVLTAMGYVSPTFVSATDKGFAFTAANRDRCPNCSHDHERQNWWAIAKEDEYVVANYSDRCTTKRYPRQVEAIVPAHANFEDSLALLDLDDEQASKLRSALHYHETVVKVACYRPECLACERHHDCTTYTARQIIPRHCWTVRNDDNSCRGRVFHHTSRLADKLHSLFVCPNEESLIGLFLEGHAGTIHVERHTRTTYLWDCAPRGGGRWRKLTATEFDSHVGLWLNTLLQGIGELAEFKDHNKAIKQAQGKVTPGGIAKLKQQIQGRISLQALQGGQREAVMDGNPLLLGAGASVIELKAVDEETGGFTTLLRNAGPEDLVTMSVGYDIPDSGFGDTAAVEAVFAQIYPMEEERRFFQLYGGYCLLGNNPAKGFMCLTDRRKGDNGKSTAVNLLRRALGPEYVIDNKQNLLYEARYSTNVNAHDAGMLAFEGKRLAIMEELSASKTLDTSVMKQLTGGEAHISVRPAGGAETRSMLWSAKLITVFNEGCAPRFKVEDEAFTKRMIVMPHRSMFCKDDASRSAHAGEPLTFDADGGKIEALTPWQVLGWLLKGLERYWSMGQLEFQVPPTCREWAGGLVQEQDEVAQWVSVSVEPREDKYFTLGEAYKHFCSGGGGLQQRAFKHRLQTLLAANYVSSKKIDGNTQRNVFWQLALTD